MKIQTRVFEYGNEKEADWPPMFGNRKSGVSHWDPIKKKMVEGYPPRKEPVFGKAPMVIQDSMDAERHPMTGETVDSRARWRRIDRENGLVTTDRHEPASDAPIRKRDAEIRKDRSRALRKAVAAIDNNMAPINEETRVLCERQNEIVSKALNFDAFNVVGRKKNARGKKHRR